jgi:hypothetical protein
MKTMYLLKIQPEQMEKLYYLREERKNNGEKSSIAGIVRDAINSHLSGTETEVRSGRRLVLEKEQRIKDLEMEQTKRKNELAKKRIEPERIELIERLDKTTANFLTDKKYEGTIH